MTLLLVHCICPTAVENGFLLVHFSCASPQSSLSQHSTLLLHLPYSRTPGGPEPLGMNRAIYKPAFLFVYIVDLCTRQNSLRKTTYMMPSLNWTISSADHAGSNHYMIHMNLYMMCIMSNHTKSPFLSTINLRSIPSYLSTGCSSLLLGVTRTGVLG